MTEAVRITGTGGKTLRKGTDPMSPEKEGGR